ncbi:uncharacterized protein LOC117167583 [Belonocnema kinseyi]|uniref:uncharacterized protein LOC117167583 n=1 Tax=Belonocnema kinseyi TaxID=2817044 RepID=UPI00143D52F9|nr:uncharacterized protein LOC117167583 [Belonocnema kinseyi]
MKLQILSAVLLLLQVTSTLCFVRIRRMESDVRLEHFTECKKQLGVSDEIIRTTENYWQAEKLKCLMACMFEKDGLWGADRKFNIDQFMEEFAEDTELESKKAAALKEICFEEAKVHDEYCDFANTLFKCCIETYENFEAKERKESKKAS